MFNWRKNFVLCCNSNYESNELRERESSLAFHGVVIPFLPVCVVLTFIPEEPGWTLVTCSQSSGSQEAILMFLSLYDGSTEVYNGFTLSWTTFRLLTPFLRLAALVNYCTCEVVTNVVLRKWRAKNIQWEVENWISLFCVLDRFVFGCRRSYKSAWLLQYPGWI